MDKQKYDKATIVILSLITFTIIEMATIIIILAMESKNEPIRIESARD